MPTPPPLLSVTARCLSPLCPTQAWHAWAVMNFEAVLHYKHQNQARDEKKKLRHASGANITNTTTAASTAAATTTATSTEGSNSESEAESSENSPTPSPLQKKVAEVPSPSPPGTTRAPGALSGHVAGLTGTGGFPPKRQMGLESVAYLPCGIVGASVCTLVFGELT